MLRLPCLLFAATVLAASANAQSSDHARILDVQPFVSSGTPLVVQAGGVPVAIPTDGSGYNLQVAIEGMAYTGQFGERRNARSADLIVGDTANISVEGKRMYLHLANGKKVWGRLVRRERLSPAPPPTQVN